MTLLTEAAKYQFSNFQPCFFFSQILNSNTLYKKMWKKLPKDTTFSVNHFSKTVPHEQRLWKHKSFRLLKCTLRILLFFCSKPPTVVLLMLQNCRKKFFFSKSHEFFFISFHWFRNNCEHLRKYKNKCSVGTIFANSNTSHSTLQCLNPHFQKTFNFWRFMITN